ncbi:unnamed protein product, partial [Discosporangium mesarthrocarpum]
HEEALVHAQSAVFHSQEGAGDAFGEDPSRAGTVNKAGGYASGGWGGGGASEGRGPLVTLAVAYYNLAVELEFTEHKDLCFHWYNKAILLAKSVGLQNEELLKTFQSSFAAARK